MTAFSALAGADVQRTGIRIEVAHLNRGKFAKPASGQERGLDEVTELVLAGIDQSATFLDRQIADARRVSFFERFDSTPRFIGRDLLFPPCPVERSFKNCQYAIRRCA